MFTAAEKAKTQPQEERSISCIMLSSEFTVFLCVDKVRVTQIAQARPGCPPRLYRHKCRVITFSYATPKNDDLVVFTADCFVEREVWGYLYYYSVCILQ